MSTVTDLVPLTCSVTLLRDPLHMERDRQVVPCRPGQWLSEVVPDCCTVGDWVAVDGGLVIAREEWSQHLLVPGSEILLYPRLANSTVFKVVTGIVFAPLGVYWMLRAAGMPSWASGLLTGGPIGMSLFPAIENIVAGKRAPANVPSTSSDLASSPTYGFNGIQNNTRIGSPIPVVYGNHRVGGQILNTYVETRNDNDVLHILLAVSEGQVESINDFEINGQSVENYTGVYVQTRYGTNVQSAIGLFGDKSATTFSADGQLTTSFITYTTQGTTLNGFVVKLTFPGGLFIVHNTGGLGRAVVDVEVDYKLSSSGSWTTGPRVSFVDYKRAVLRRQIRVDSLAAGQYDIRVRRTTTESTSNSKVDGVLREAVTELINDGYTYPNTALVALEAVATNQLSGGIPRVTALVAGVRVKQFVANLTYFVNWTQSPAWIVFDMLTNERYGHGRFTWKVLRTGIGLNVTFGSVTFSGTATGWTAATLRRGDVLHDPVGQAVGIVKTINYGTQSGTFEQVWGGPTASNRAYEVRSNDLDIASFVMWDNFCSVLVPAGNGSVEPRALCNMVFDAEREDVWSAVLRICAVGQASAIKMGSYIRIKIETVATPVQLFTMANIKADSFEEVFLSLKDRSNIFEVQFLNEAKGYQQDMVVLEDPLIYTNSEQPRRKTVSGYGITRSSHAARLARFNHRVNRLVTRTITFEVGLDAVACEPGDVIRFQHDIPQWGFAGRAVAGSTSTTLVLDRAVTLVGGKSYEVLVRFANDVVETRAVASGAGTWTTLDIVGTWSQTPAKGDIWAFGEIFISTKPFRVITIERTQDLEARLTAVEYSAAVYDETGLTAANQVQYSALGDLLGPPGQVKHLTILEQAGIEQSVWVSFTPPGSGNFKTATIYRIDDGVKTVLGQSATGAFPVAGLRGGDVFTVKVTTVSSLGVESDYTAAPVASIIVTPVNPPDVQGLVLEGERLRWSYPDPPSDLDGFLVRFRAGTSTDWASATPAHVHLLKTTDFQIFKRQGSQTYLVKAVDRFANESLNAKALTVSYDGVITDNIVFIHDHRALGWPGTITAGAVISGDLKADSSAVFWTGDTAAMWSPSAATLMWSAAFDQMTYEFTVTPSSDQLDAMLKLQLTMAGIWSIEYQADSSAGMWSATTTVPMWGSAGADMWGEIGPYMQWPGQIDHLRIQPYKIRIIGHSGTVQAVLEELVVILDVRDILETLEHVPISSVGTRLALTKSYRNIVMVRVELAEDGGSAAYVKVIDKDPTLGPLIKAYTSANALTTAVIDAVVHGY